LALLLTACSTNLILQSHDNKVIGIQARADSTILSIITPYQAGIEDQMSEVLTYTKNDLEKGRPQSTMGNFVTDLCLNYADADICVMNNGGLRTTFSEGGITRGNLYELMPFENELVILELDKDDYLDLLNYIGRSGGEPFSGFTIVLDNDGKIIRNSWPVNFENGERVRVLTSDYLANGGDKMSFFKQKKQQKVGIKFRDAIIDYCSKKDTINIQLDDRIITLGNE
jgi:2',3'-cyclic-nucleotide 2'-phosphodiesterase (5'-nucleotidase family)